MKICVLNPYFFPYRGGIERRIYGASKHLSKKHEVCIVTSRLPGTKKREIIDGINIVRLKSFFLNVYNPPILVSKGIVDEIKEIDPDIIDFHYRWSVDYTLAMNKIMKKKPSIFTFHNGFGEGEGILQPISYVNDALFKIFLLKYDKIICVSEFIKNYLVKKGLPKNKLTTIYNGIELIHKAETKDKNYLLFIGRLVRTKGLDYLIKAISMVNNPRTRLKICGQGPELKRLKKLANKHNLNKKIEFLGWVTEEKKIELIKECKCFVLPSTFESFGIVLLEAMKYQKPIIATKIGGIPEVVGNAGILVKPRSPRELAGAIDNIYLDEESRKKMSANARKQVEKFSWENIIPKLEKVYRSVL